MREPKANRSIIDLNSMFQFKLKEFLHEMENIDPMSAHETLRSDERQVYLIKSGKSKVKRSNHQDGNAADLHFIIPPYFPKNIERWEQAARIAKKHGIDCGGVLWGWDWNHFQDDGSKKQILITKKKNKMNKSGIKFNSKAFNRDDEQVINNVSRYLMDRVAPKTADLKNDQQIDLNDSYKIDKTPGMKEYIKAFGVFFPQVISLLFYKDKGFINAKEWGWLETMTQFLPAIRVGVDNDKINLSNPEMTALANLIYKKGKQVATGTLEIRDENKEAGQK